MVKKRKGLLELRYTLTALLNEVVEEYRHLYFQLCSTEPEKEYCKDRKNGFNNFLSDILHQSLPLISSFDSIKELATISYLKSQDFYLIPVPKQYLGDGVIKIREEVIDRLVDAYISIQQPKSLSEGVSFLSLISPVATITQQKDGICEELNITFKYKQDENEKNFLINYLKALAIKMGYTIREIRLDPTLIKIRCCK